MERIRLFTLRLLRSERNKCALVSSATSSSSCGCFSKRISLLTSATQVPGGDALARTFVRSFSSSHHPPARGGRGGGRRGGGGGRGAGGRREGERSQIDLRDWKSGLERWQAARKGRAEAFDRVACNDLLRLCRRDGGTWKEAVQVLKVMEKEGPRPDNHSYGVVIDMCANSRQADLTLELYERMLERGIQPTILAENGRLKAWRDQGRYEEILEAVDTKPSSSQRRNIITYNIAISACTKVKRWRRALEYLEAAQSEFHPTTMTYNGVIHACAKAGEAQEAVNVFDRMVASGSTPDTFTYGGAIDACAKGGKLDKCLELFLRLQAQGLQPNEVIWGSLLDACRRVDRLDVALKLVRQMESQGTKANEVMIANLIDLHGRVGAWEGAVSLLDKAVREREGKKDGKAKLGILYTSAISACGRACQWRQALALLQKMLVTGVKPDEITFGAAIQACHHAGQFSAGLRLFQRMEDEGVKPSIGVYKIVIKSYVHSEGKWQDALNLLETMERRHGCRPDAAIVEKTLAILAKFGRYEEAVQLYRSIPSRGLPHTNMAATQVMLALANSKQGKIAKAFLDELRNNTKGPAPNGTCYSHAVLALSRAGMTSEARRLLFEMKGRGFFKNLGEQSILDKCQEGELEEAANLAASITEAIESLDAAPGQLTLNVALTIYGKAGDWDGAISLVRRMDKQGVSPTEKTYQTLLQVTAAAGQWPVALYMLDEQALMGGFRTSLCLGSVAQHLDNNLLSFFGPSIYRRLHSLGVISHRHREEKGGDYHIVDFHGFCTREALCALKAILEELVVTHGTHPQGIKSLVIVVGVGRRSGTGVGVLGPYLVGALSSDMFDPPLKAQDVPYNPGRIILPRTELIKYVEANKQNREITKSSITLLPFLDRAIPSSTFSIHSFPHASASSSSASSTVAAAKTSTGPDGVAEEDTILMQSSST